ncbi:FAD-dependent oxidoreductase [Dongia sp.]|uniref:FAD-dependent oxidoreductase n=1 Tax=Dongia sp. TaxID=1977262 RepID=UPI003750742E
MTMNDLPIAVIGAGPVGLAAAANLVERNIPVRVYEAGNTVGANLQDWAHVRIFTPWEQSVDPVSRRLLEAEGWSLPRSNALPTGGDLVDRYLLPLSRVPGLAAAIETGAKVTAISRQGIDKVASRGRETKPFALRIRKLDGSERVDLARVVIDASGTWQNPNPLGATGLPAMGEAESRDHLAYGMPDILGRQRECYAGKRVAVVGAGYSAINVLLDLTKLESAGTLLWVVRGKNMAKIYGGGDADELAARGKLGQHLKSLVDSGRVTLVTGFATESVARSRAGVTLSGQVDGDAVTLPEVDEIIVATGQRPDLEMTRELRLELDPWLESVKVLGPMIDPNLHSCGSVEPHGHRELSHPEPGFYTIGVKSYGRAPTFLLLTGYEQARSVAAAIAGDRVAADNVHLVLPDTGICQTDFDEEGAGCCAPLAAKSVAAKTAGCCGGPAIVREDACCVADEVAKDEGRKGCGCGVAA